MAATTAGAIKAKLEGLSLSVPVFRDKAPDGHTLPYITITEAISIVPDGNYDDTTLIELAQVDVWQAWKDAAGAVIESYTLPGAVFAGLSGTSLPAAPTHVYGVTVDSMVRRPPTELGVVQHALTVRIRRVR